MSYITGSILYREQIMNDRTKVQNGNSTKHERISSKYDVSKLYVADRSTG